MNRKLVLAACSACLLFLSSRATLEVDSDTHAGKADVGPTVDSLTYNLSETTIVVTGTMTLNDCDSIIAQRLVDNDSENAQAASAGGALTHNAILPKASPPVDISSTFTVASVAQADPSFQYQIPYSSLENWTKQLNLTVARNSNKTLLSRSASPKMPPTPAVQTRKD